ncbi:hypothetical protein [Dokdonella sp.]|uniref:hypothetical protein n=1 Tax=Dokdonella sp. TaxID=2291710 RepID=UPI0035272190
MLFALLATSAAIAQADDAKVDSASVNPAVAPIIRVSTNTVIDYPGGTPPGNVVGSFDAQDSTFNRPVTCGSLSGVGTAVPFDTITLTNSGANTATLNIRLGQQGDPSTACGTVIDPFLVEYDGSFNPASPLTNCLLVNDDTNGSTDRCPSFTGISIPSGSTRVYVLTTFDNAAAFNYEVTFAGTTPVSLQSFEIE